MYIATQLVLYRLTRFSFNFFLNMHIDLHATILPFKLFQMRGPTCLKERSNKLLDAAV